MRDKHCDDYAKEKEISALELKLCKSVADNCTNECLEEGTHKRDSCCVKECKEVFIFHNDELPLIEIGMTGNKFYRYIYKVIGTHKGVEDLCKEGINNDIRNTDKKNESENLINKFACKLPGEVLKLKSFLE